MVERAVNSTARADDYIVLVEGSTAYTRSSAFLRVMLRLPFPWPLAAAAWIIPALLRNWMYDRIARNRYRMFGRHDVCAAPTPDPQRRFLGGRRANQGFAFLGSRPLTTVFAINTESVTRRKS
jgi:predicted DCC family thiol-disulfide oxidoreductase YuxK